MRSSGRQPQEKRSHSPPKARRADALHPLPQPRRADKRVARGVSPEKKGRIPPPDRGSAAQAKRVHRPGRRTIKKLGASAPRKKVPFPPQGPAGRRTPPAPTGPEGRQTSSSGRQPREKRSHSPPRSRQRRAGKARTPPWSPDHQETRGVSPEKKGPIPPPRPGGPTHSTRSHRPGGPPNE